ncbi:hypothetical protein OKW39_003493 [Paraburkholderia sp. MM6662-R1]
MRFVTRERGLALAFRGGHFTFYRECFRSGAYGYFAQTERAGGVADAAVGACRRLSL